MLPIDMEMLKKMQMLLPLPNGGFSLHEPKIHDVPDPVIPDADAPLFQFPITQHVHQDSPQPPPHQSPLLPPSPAPATPDPGPSTSAPPPPIFTGFPYTTLKDEDRKPTALEKQINRMEVTID